MIRGVAVAVMLMAMIVPLRAQDAPCAADPLEASRGWWAAFASADLDALERSTAVDFSWTVSVGWTYDRKGMLAKAATHDPKAKIVFDWKEGAVRRPVPAVAIVTNRLVETIRNTPPIPYRYLSVLECREGRWMVVAAQSTREAELSPRVPLAEGVTLAQFAGSYRTRAGGVLKVAERDGGLVLTDPSGAESRLEPVGLDLFELADVVGAGVIRFAFHRGADGRVVAFSRLGSTIATFPRIEAAP